MSLYRGVIISLRGQRAGCIQAVLQWQAQACTSSRRNGCVGSGAAHKKVSDQTSAMAQAAAVVCTEASQVTVQRVVRHGRENGISTGGENRRQWLHLCSIRGAPGAAAEQSSHAPRPRPQQDGGYVAPVRFAPPLKEASNQRMLHRLGVRHAQAVLLRNRRAERQTGRQFSCIAGRQAAGPRRTLAEMLQGISPTV